LEESENRKTLTLFEKNSKRRTHVLEHFSNVSFSFEKPVESKLFCKKDRKRNQNNSEEKFLYLANSSLEAGKEAL